MAGFKLSDQVPPEARPIAPGVVSRFEHIYEVDPALMTEHVRQQEIPNWDFKRIVDSRWEHLYWIKDHFSDAVISGQELLDEIDAEG